MRLPHPIRLLRSLVAALALVAASALGACSGDGGTGPGENTAPLVHTLLRGTVLDTLSLTPVHGALVSTSAGTALTDTLGEFTVRARLGINDVTVAHLQYVFATFDWDVGADPPPVAVTLRPLAPVIRGCDFRSGRLRALITDLQGRKTVVKLDSSGVQLGAAAGGWVPGEGFNWFAVDSLTWLVELPAEAGAPAEALWRVFDTDGNARQQPCPSEGLPDRPGTGAPDEAI